MNIFIFVKQEEALKEENEAMQKIAMILSNLTSKKTNMVQYLCTLSFHSCSATLKYNWTDILSISIIIRSQKHQET